MSSENPIILDAQNNAYIASIESVPSKCMIQFQLITQTEVQLSGAVTVKMNGKSYKALVVESKSDEQPELVTVRFD